METEHVTASDVQFIYRSAGRALPTPDAKAMAEQANREADGVHSPADLVRGWLEAEKAKATIH